MKYVMTTHFIIHKGKRLHRIKAVKSFGDVKKGEYGGYIESYDNLSQRDECWVADEAKVYGLSLIHI